MAEKKVPILGTKEHVTVVAADPTFTKQNLMNSSTFANRKDALMVLLEDDKQYTKKEAEDILYNFMKGKVN